MSTARQVPASSVASNWLQLGLAISMSLPWTLCALLGWQTPDLLTAVLGGISILGAAFLLSCGVETA